MKNIVLVSKGNFATGYGEGIEVSKIGTSGAHANLLVLNEIMEKIPTDLSIDNYRIFLMDLNNYIQSGYAKEYVKTGKFLNGNAIPEDVLAEIKKHYKLYGEGERYMNVNYGSTAYIAKGKDTQAKELKTIAYKKLDEFIANNKSAGTTTTTQIVNDPDKALREKFDEQITKAMEAGNMEMLTQLMEMRKSLREPEVVGVQTSAPVNQSALTPEFDVNEGKDLNDLNGVDTNHEEDDDDGAIEFEPAKSNKIEDWDSTSTQQQA